jgi:hypothetical protein
MRAGGSCEGQRRGAFKPSTPSPGAAGHTLSLHPLAFEPSGLAAVARSPPHR